MDLDLKNVYDELVTGQRILASEYGEQPCNVSAKSETSMAILSFNRLRPDCFTLCTSLDPNFTHQSINTLYETYGHLDYIKLDLTLPDNSSAYVRFETCTSYPEIIVSNYGKPLETSMKTVVDDLFSILDISYKTDSDFIKTNYLPHLKQLSPGDIVELSRILRNSYPELKTSIFSLSNESPYSIAISTERENACTQGEEHLLVQIDREKNSIHFDEEVEKTLDSISALGIDFGNDWDIFNSIENQTDITFGHLENNGV